MEGTQPHRTTNREEMQTYRTPELQNSVEQAQPSFFKKTLLKYFALLSTITRKNIMLRRNHPGSSSSGHIISWTYPHKEFPPSLRGWSGELPPSPSYRPGPKMQTQKKMRQPKGRSRGRGKKTERKSVFILKKGKKQTMWEAIRPSTWFSSQRSNPLPNVTVSCEGSAPTPLQAILAHKTKMKI